MMNYYNQQMMQEITKDERDMVNNNEGLGILLWVKPLVKYNY